VGYSSPNPLFMRYGPDASGAFVGQSAYGYASIANFIQAAASVNAGETKTEDWEDHLATVSKTKATTAILEAGRLSLDQKGARIKL